MAAIGNIPEIIEVKQQLEELKSKGLIRDWELPYENLLTRLSAAIFFVEPNADDEMKEAWAALEKIPAMRYRPNEEKKLSEMKWRVEFGAEPAF